MMNLSKTKQAIREENADIRSKLYEDSLKCRLCDYESKFSLLGHVRHKHKMKMSEYRERYPDDVVQRQRKTKEEDLEWRRKIKDWFTDEENYRSYSEKRSFPSEIKHWTNKGLSEKEAKIKVTEHQRALAIKQNNPECKKRQSERTSGDNNPMSLESISKRHGVTIEEAKKMTPCYGRTGEKHPMFGKNHTEEALEKIAKNTPVTFFNKSKKEVDLGNKISEKYEIKRNTHIGRYNCDIVHEESKTIVEYFGDYWHMNPKKYEKDFFNERVKMTAQDRWENDEIKIEFLKNKGYNVIVVWESDWNDNQEKVLTEVIDVINSKKNN